MNSIDFCYWLQGHFELSERNNLTDKQVQAIRNHLNLVFLHEIDPLRESQTDASKEELDAAHSPAKPPPTEWPDGIPAYLRPNGGHDNDNLIRC